MSNPIPPLQYEIFTTADGSPTLSLRGGEKMHSLEGAFSETLYIYGPCARKALDAEKPAILSMGLGLGYNELMAMAFLLKGSKTDFFLASFEAIPFLRQEFLDWLTKDTGPLKEVYDEILRRTAEEFQILENSIKSSLLEAYGSQRFYLGETLPSKNPFPTQFHGILYDAFSSETDPSLWSEEHFLNFMDDFCAPDLCSFATYAATGKLKRALKAREFVLEKKHGFGAKRESTFAQRTLS